MYKAYLGEAADLVPGRKRELKRSVSGMIRALENTQDRLREHARVLASKGDGEEAARCRSLARRLTADLKRLRLELALLEGQPESAVLLEDPGVDYGKYRVDTSVPHFISEDLENRRPAGFRFLGARYEARTWKQVLIEVCGALNRQDPMLFSSLEGDPDLMGRVRPRLSSDPNRLLDPSRVPDARMYVETHLSAGLLVRILRTLLIKFEIPASELELYLDKDYTPLRRERQEQKRAAERSAAGDEQDRQIDGQLSLEFGEQA